MKMYTEGDGAKLVVPNSTIMDIDSDKLQNIKLQFKFPPPDGADESLAVSEIFALSKGITASYIASLTAMTSIKLVANGAGEVLSLSSVPKTSI